MTTGQLLSPPLLLRPLADETSIELQTMNRIADAADDREADDHLHKFRIALAWKCIRVTLTNAEKKRQKVLDSVTGYAEPGCLLAIMGPSGSGKTTLLDTLSGRLPRNATRSGNVWINGQKQTPPHGIAAYVTQDDTLIGTLTVRESISYSANLRLPSGMSRGQISCVVERAIFEMGLEECSNTPIGNWHLRGLSGGEKRRVSIATEILTRPRLLFLDEPTSGLDSASAFFVVKTLQKLAQDGRTILASIHQPSSEVFELFDHLFLLSNGRTVYFGETAGAFEHFARAGFPCPPLRNPSDHFLRAINSDFDRAKFGLRDSLRPPTVQSGDSLCSTALDTATVVDILVSTYKNSTSSLLAVSRVHEISQMNGAVLESFGSDRCRFWIQASTLTRRSFKNMYRDMGYYWLRLSIYITVSFCIGTIYYRVGTDNNSIMARASCMSYISGFLTFMAIGGFPSFVEDMKVFSRERLNGHYGVTAFVLGNSISSLPFLFLISWSSATVCYFMVWLHPGVSHFVYFLLCLFAGMVVVESLMMAIASMVPNYLMGIITGAGIQGIYLLVAGFFRLPDDLPKPLWKYPLFYLSFHSYSLQGMYRNDFLGLTFASKSEEAARISGQIILEESFQITTSRSKWWDLAILFGMALGYRAVFFFIIKLREQVRLGLGEMLGRSNSMKLKYMNNFGRQLPTVRPVLSSARDGQFDDETSFETHSDELQPVNPKSS